ncbi:UGSC family (seleno)protein [Actinomycetospora sp. CA-084318]|uniref:UGSC family (seleno)protein n=1 Tax=Actinomycetospora sp. CA-084318 TaxID=3239892 RepID=UPI003D99D5C7
MPAVMRAAATAERAGVPAVAIGGAGFEGMGRAIGRSLGVPHVPIVSYPGVILTDDTVTFRTKMREQVAPAVVDALVAGSAASDQALPDVEPSPTDVVVRGDLDAVTEHFEARGWTDGLPIVPPTPERVAAFLAHTRRDPDEVLGVLAPEQRQATVRSVAVTGVMAGCRPEYMGVLVAVVECLADPVWRVQDAGSTPGWEPLVVLSGPVVERLDLNSGTGALRVGRRANTSIGRFTRLYLRNLAGLRIPPEHTDQGAIASTFHVALAENDDAVRGLGWPSFRADRGFADDDSVVTVQSVVTVSAPIYSGGETVRDHLDALTRGMADAIGPWAYTGLEFGAFHPLLVLGPAVAAALARGGVDKAAIRAHLGEHLLVSASALQRCAWNVGSTSFDLDAMAASGELDARYGGTEPDRVVPMLARPDDLGIVLAGNESRNQSRGFVQNHVQGVPVSHRIEDPS